MTVFLHFHHHMRRVRLILILILITHHFQIAAAANGAHRCREMGPARLAPTLRACYQHQRTCPWPAGLLGSPILYVFENDSIHHDRDTSLEYYITRYSRTHGLTYLRPEHPRLGFESDKSKTATDRITTTTTLRARYLEVTPPDILSQRHNPRRHSRRSRPG